MRDPGPAWLRVGLVGACIVVSLTGWAIAERADTALESAQRNARTAVTESRSADLADARAARALATGHALAAIVVQRCDTGQIRDTQLCDTARQMQR